MADNVVTFTGITRLGTPPDRILEEAAGKLESVVIVGIDVDEDFFFASSMADGGEMLWLMERARHKLMQKADELEEGAS